MNKYEILAINAANQWLDILKNEEKYNTDAEFSQFLKTNLFEDNKKNITDEQYLTFRNVLCGVILDEYANSIEKKELPSSIILNTDYHINSEILKIAASYGKIDDVCFPNKNISHN